MSDNKSGYIKLIARITKIKDNIAFQAGIGLIVGLAFICLIGWYLWLYFRWEPIVDLSAIQPFLIGVIQIQAGILAIAISFSLLYLQVSVEAYSLRASKLLVTHKSFQMMIRDYMFILVVNSSLAIFAIEQPWFIPILAVTLGAGFFIASLFVLIKFIRDVAEFITPETMVQEIFRRYSMQKIYAEGIEKLVPRDLYKDTDLEKLEEMHITIPSIGGSPDQFGDGMNMLIDISRRMIGQADNSIVQGIINQLTPSYYDYKSYRQSHYFDSRDLGVNEPKNNNDYDLDDYTGGEYEAYGIETDIDSPLDYQSDLEIDLLNQPVEKRDELLSNVEDAARFAYIAGGLLQIWSACVWSNNKLVAVAVINAYKRLVDGKLFQDDVYITDFFDTVLKQNLFVDTSKLGWIDLRPAVIEIVSDNYDFDFRNRHYPIGYFENRHFANFYYNYFHYLIKVLDGESSIDTTSLHKAVDGLEKVMIYAAAIGSPAIAEFETILSYYLPKRIEISHRDIAKTIERVGKLWATAATKKKVYRKSYSRLMGHGLRNFFTQRFYILKELNSDETVNSYVAPFLNSLEFITMECVRANQPEILAETLTEMYHVGHYLSPNDSWFAVACIEESFEEAVKKKKLEIITKWLEASERNIRMLTPLSKEAYKKMSTTLKSSIHQVREMYRKRNLDDKPLRVFVEKFKTLSVGDSEIDISQYISIKDWKPR